MTRRARFILFAPFALTGMLVFIAFGGWVVKLLWNWLLPPLFGWHVITFWQALGLLVLSRILFGGFGIHGSHGHHRRPLSERWKDMSPEERERFRKGMWGRMGFAPTSREEDARGTHTV